MNKLKETGIQAHDHQPFSGLFSSEFTESREINLIFRSWYSSTVALGQQAGVLQNLRKTTVVEDFK